MDSLLNGKIDTIGMILKKGLEVACAALRPYNIFKAVACWMCCWHCHRISAVHCHLLTYTSLHSCKCTDAMDCLSELDIIINCAI